MSARLAIAVAVFAVAARASAAALYVPELPEPTRPAHLASDDGDTSFTDLRLSVTVGIGAGWSADLHGNGERTVEGDLRGAFAIRGELVGTRGLGRFGGFLWSAGVDLRRSEADLVVPDADLYVVGCTLGGGYGVPFGRYVELELLPYVALGVAALDDHQGEPLAQMGQGWLLGVGGRATLAFTLDNGLQVAATGGYEASWISLHRDGVYDAAIEIGGWSVGASVGKRF